MASGLITSWQMNGETVETVKDFNFLSSKITADCCHEIKRCLLLGRKAMTKLVKVKVESEKVALKLNIQKTKIMASGPISSWQIDRETMKQCQTLFLGAPKSLQIVTAAMN